ncbi:MAG: HIT family protein [Candidatus Helarchaeota archaeon]
MSEVAMTNCVFCEIIAGRKMANKIYEDKEVLSFLDHRPIRLGHTLVIPKKHYETILDIPDEELAYLIQIVKKLAKHIKFCLNATGLRISNNNYPSARQIVPHLHFHIIPTMGQAPFKLNLKRIEVSPIDLESLAQKLRIQSLA